MDESSDGFLGRWSRRKALAREGAVQPEPSADEAATPVAVTAPPAPPSQPPATPADPAVAPAPPPPTLQDVELLTHGSDFSRFVAPGVGGEVRNAAMKKLFSDPHFNVMDGLDTYIDDYGKPDPLPLSALRKMAQAKFLGLFDDENDRPDPTPTGIEPVRDAPREGPAPDENPDLRLQSNDAAGREGAEPGAGEDPGRVD